MPATAGPSRRWRKGSATTSSAIWRRTIRTASDAEELHHSSGAHAPDFSPENLVAHQPGDQRAAPCVSAAGWSLVGAADGPAGVPERAASAGDSIGAGGPHQWADGEYFVSQPSHSAPAPVVAG